MSESESLTPRDQAERVALFRAELIGAVSRRELSHGELAAALRTLAAERYLPPGSKTLRYFGVSTFERWLYAYRAHGLAGLDRQAVKLGAPILIVAMTITAATDDSSHGAEESPG